MHGIGCDPCGQGIKRGRVATRTEGMDFVCARCQLSDNEQEWGAA